MVHAARTVPLNMAIGFAAVILLLSCSPRFGVVLATVVGLLCESAQPFLHSRCAAKGGLVFSYIVWCTYLHFQADPSQLILLISRIAGKWMDGRS